jgi:hypothetical protein
LCLSIIPSLGRNQEKAYRSAFIRGPDTMSLAIAAHAMGLSCVGLRTIDSGKALFAGQLGAVRLSSQVGVHCGDAS